MGFRIVKILATTLGETGGDARDHVVAWRNDGRAKGTIFIAFGFKLAFDKAR